MMPRKQNKTEVHIKITTITEDNKKIDTVWIAPSFKNTHKGKEQVTPGHWLSFLQNPDGSSVPCRMPIRLVEQRTRDDKARMVGERMEQDRQAIIAAKVKKAEGFGL